MNITIGVQLISVVGSSLNPPCPDGLPYLAKSHLQISRSLTGGKTPWTWNRHCFFLVSSYTKNTFFLTFCSPCISIFNQLDAQNLFHVKFYLMPLHVSSTCAHHQEVKIALHSLWYLYTYRCHDTRQRTDIGKYSFVNRTIQHWNQLPAEVLGILPCKPITFKKRARKVIIELN